MNQQLVVITSKIHGKEQTKYWKSDFYTEGINVGLEL
jgi:hypothetical protein